MAIPKEVVAKLDAASNAFDGVITKTEQKIFDSAVELIKKLDVDASGNIKMSTANLKVLSDIKSRLAQITSKDKAYLQGVKELAAEFDSIYKSQSAYYAKHFAEKTLNDKAKAKYEAMKRVAVTTTIDGLTGAGLQSNVLDPLAKTLLRAVTSGAKYADLVNELRNQLMTTDTGEGSLAKYAKTYATTALTQYAGQNNKLFTDDLGAEWFQYVGSEIETTREFCHHLTAKEFIHVSEIPDILAGKIEYDGKVHQCKMNPKTDLPYGLIEGTTPENFQVNVGGWNCRHQLVPVAKEAVPQNIRAKFDKQTQEEIANQKAEEERKKAEEAKKQQIAELQKQLEPFAKWKDSPIAGIQSAVAAGDIPALEKYIGNLHDIESALTKLTMLVEPEKAMQEFTLSELQAVNDAVVNKMQQFASKGITGEQLAKKLQFESQWVQDNKKYPTWQIAQQAYNKQLADVQKDIALKALLPDVTKLMSVKTKSPQFKAMLQELTKAYGDGDIPKTQQLIADMQTKAAAMQKRQQQYAAKHLQTDFDDDAYSQSRKNGAMWEKGTNAQEKTDAKLRAKIGETWQSASDDEKDAAYGYTAGSCYLNEPLLGISYCGGKGGRAKFEKHANALTAFIGRNKYTFDKWVQRGGDVREINARFGINLESYRPKDANGHYINGTVDALIGKTGIEHGFLSTGSCKGNGFSGNVIMNIYCPRGTQGIYAEPFSAYGRGGGREWDGVAGQSLYGHEFETILQRETEFRITKVEYKNGTWFIDMDVISQRPPALTAEQLAHA